MAKTITTTVTVQVVGDGLNHTDTYQQVNATGAPALYFPAATGNLPINVGTYPGMIGALLVPPSGSGVPKTLKGVVGDQGIPLAPGLPLLAFFFGGGIVLAYGGSTEALQAVLT